MLALRSAKAGTLKYLYGLSEETTESENLQAQAPQAHEGESPQEAFALQVVTAPRVSRFRSGSRLEFASLRASLRALPRVTLPVTLVDMTFGKNWPALPSGAFFVCGLLFARCSVCPRSICAASRRPRAGRKAIPTRNASAHGRFRSRSIPRDGSRSQPANARKADALADFVEGARLEENGEIETALWQLIKRCSTSIPAKSIWPRAWPRS